MRTWWICRHAMNGVVDIMHLHKGVDVRTYSAHLPMIGPFWTYEEAQRVLEFWTK